jgi:hypothetical protein
MERAIEIFAGINFLIIGLSHVLQPRVWIDFFVGLRGQGLSGAFTNGFLSLSFGSLIVAFHNVWTGPAMILTLVGWAQVAKAFVNFVAPQFAMRGLHRPSPERAWEMQFAGVVFLALSGVMAYLVAQRG